MLPSWFLNCQNFLWWLGNLHNDCPHIVLQRRQLHAAFTDNWWRYAPNVHCLFEHSFMSAPVSSHGSHKQQISTSHKLWITCRELRMCVPESHMIQIFFIWVGILFCTLSRKVAQFDQFLYACTTVLFFCVLVLEARSNLLPQNLRDVCVCVCIHIGIHQNYLFNL